MTKIRENAEQKLKTDVGQPYIDVVQPDADGKEVSLKSVVENPGDENTSCSTSGLRGAAPAWVRFPT